MDANAPAGGHGLSWGDAHQDVQVALLAATAVAPAQVWVARGTYFPDAGTGNRDASFVIPAGVTLLGGFAVGETHESQRDPVANLTVLSGDIGQSGVEADNSRHVVLFPPSADASAVLDGFTIERGNADGLAYPTDSGGGILVDGGSPVMRSCTLVQCTAKFGGGLYSRPGSPVIERTRFLRNVATADGGGMNVNGSAVLRECTFDANRASFGGGMVACCGFSRIFGSTFTGNIAAAGGGLFSPVGTLWVVGCTFEANTGGNGGAINTSSASSAFNVVSTKFAGNSATQGGAMYATNAPVVFNCVFTKNTSMQRGAGLYLQGNAKITNCTVYSNWSLTQGGGIYASLGVPMLANSILWANADTQASVQAGQLSSASGLWTINYCNVQGWTGAIPGVGNTGLGPSFSDPPGYDQRLGTGDDAFRLLAGSRAIDAGDVLLVPIDVWDLDGDGNTSERASVDIAGVVRPVDDPASADYGPGLAPHVDMGAYERQAACGADFDGSGFVDFEDYSAFVVMFDLGDLAADFDDSGFVDIEDFDAFVRAFESGC
ncbi:MAG: hypothetical protein IT435_20270 [Phycisphaerales bacterium]|nr:hypothetical protein [Phycisphaerales bacterium]